MPVDPTLLVGAVGLWVLHRRGGRTAAARVGGRGAELRFGLGLLAAVVALAPALERAAETSFLWHALQHQLLCLVAGPLIGTAWPLRRLWAAVTDRPWRRLVPVDVTVRALAAGAASLTVLLVWHLPRVYDTALADPHAHLVAHAALLGAAVALWGAVAEAARAEAAGGAIGALALTAIGGAGIGVILLTSSAPLYAHPGPPAEVLLQQQLGGAGVKVTVLLVHAGAAVTIFLRWIRRLETQPTGGSDQDVASVSSEVRSTVAPRTGA